MVERYVRDVEAAGSNPVTPTLLRVSAEAVTLIFFLCCIYAFAALLFFQAGKKVAGHQKSFDDKENRRHAFNTETLSKAAFP